MRPGGWLSLGRQMSKLGHSIASIREALMKQGCCRKSVDSVISNLRDEGKVYNSSPLAGASCQYMRDAKAGILHLIDIKRAGHSPRFTELNIPTDLDKPCFVYRPDLSHSPCGSPSAMACE